MGILSGLEGFGLGGLENIDLYGGDRKEQKKQEMRSAPETVVVTEADLLFEKTIKCPVCDREFRSRTVKMGKARLIGTDIDLRPKYETIDSLKYDVILCPNCGYAALSRFFPYITAPQAKLVRTNISQAFVNRAPAGDIYTYDEAIERYKLALANAFVKRARSSEKAYLCLKLAWVIRGKAETLDDRTPTYDLQYRKCLEEEEELIHNSLDGFLAARQSENFPICGMDESTVDYLIAVMSMKFGQLDVASKLVASIIVSPTANKRMKEKARNLKDILLDQLKHKN